MKLLSDMWRVSLWPAAKWLAVRPYYIGRAMFCGTFHAMAGCRTYQEDRFEWYCSACRRYFTYSSDI